MTAQFSTWHNNLNFATESQPLASPCQQPIDAKGGSHPLGSYCNAERKPQMCLPARMLTNWNLQVKRLFCPTARLARDFNQPLQARAMDTRQDFFFKATRNVCCGVSFHNTTFECGQQPELENPGNAKRSHGSDSRRNICANVLLVPKLIPGLCLVVGLS